MARLLLELKYYDEAGRVKPSAILSWCALFLCRSMFIFALSFILQQNSSELLSWIYPEKRYLYLSMLIAAPAFSAYLLLAFRESLTKHERYWPLLLIKPLLLLSCLLDIGLHYFLAKSLYWQFSWSIALSFLINVMIGFYLFKDRHLRLLVSDWSRPNSPIE
ncbi:DUF2919 family protein [Flavobacterium sp. W21_SRS_FM6]|uniref:DUF2919 family protein n=1 Tax=Flavobacterium sp. W21_SRS_FM6 TaxID=3240268 RepID=UPI003F92CDF8